MVNLFLSKVQKQFGGERITYSIYGIWIIGYLYAKKMSSKLHTLYN